MRFAKIQIPAYGPFTDFELLLPNGRPDFHLIHGPNEAGKSSLLRAIRALLFGIEGQTSDNFLHDYRQMRIVGDLEFTDGRVRTFQRRKGNKNTLLDARGEPLSESELAACLGAVDEAYFNAMFGLGSDQLRSGADELLRGEGRLGEALFSASMGGTPVDQVIRDLKAEADEIFSGRSSKRLRSSLQAYKEAVNQRKHALVKPEDWDRADKQLADVLQALDHLQQLHRDQVNRKNWLERCRDALETVGKLRAHQSELASLPVKSDLPISFAQELLSKRNELSTLSVEIQNLGNELEALENRMTACTVVQAVLDHAPAIRLIHEHVAAYKNEKLALIKKESESALARATVESLCRDLGMPHEKTDLEPLRLTQMQYAQAKNYADCLGAARSGLEAARERLGELRRDTEKLCASKGKCDPNRLIAVKRLREQAALALEKASGLKKRRQGLDAQNRALRELHAELFMAPSGLQETADLSIPTRVSIQQFQKRFDASEVKLRVAREKLGDCREQIRKGEIEIESLTRFRELPNLEQLRAVRAHRDRGWKLILEDWKGCGATESFVEGTPLDQAYAKAVADADSVADRLRTDANAVAQVEEKRIRLSQQREQLSVLQSEHDLCSDQLEQLQEEWVELWKPSTLSPQSPDEMVAWRERWQEFRGAWIQHQNDASELDIDTQAIHELSAAMAAMVDGVEPEFAQLFQQLDEQLKELEQASISDHFAERQIQNNEAEIAEIQERVTRLESEYVTAESDWLALSKSLSLPQDLAPGLCLELLERRRDLFREFDRHQQLLTEEAAIGERINRFETDTVLTAERVGIQDTQIEALAARLWESLQESEIQKRNLDALTSSHQDVQSKLKHAKLDLARSESDFSKLRDQAGISNKDEVDRFVAQFDAAERHRGQIAELRDVLAALARGDAVDEFIARVSEEDPEGIEGDLVNVSQQIAELDRELESAREAKHIAQSQKNELERAGDAAARHEQRAEFERARMLHDARRFIQLQSALALLRDQIDAFRSRNQGPLMSRSSHWFSMLTGGAFEGILASFADGDEPTIAGRRKGDDVSQEVPVTGMSEGTRDQLYLALRLAGLELHLQDHSPMPLILDDLLVHFDDHRAMQALSAFSEMAAQCQILLFTHHEHLVQLARTCLGSSGFIEHRLN